jgi:drug/metabolite transporter (DMT)-like permease
VRSLPLGDATAIFFSSPAFTMLLSTVLLKDHCGVYRVFIGIVVKDKILKN